MLAATLGLFIITRLAMEKIERTHYFQRADLYRYSRIHKGDIVFLGDSITDGGCWEELFPGLPVKNRGINGDDTEGVFARVDDILCCGPEAIFLLIGTNDLNWWAYKHDDEILSTYAKILKRCKEQAPQTKVYVQSILPRAKRYANHIRMLNIHLENLAENFAYSFINLYPYFADENGALKAEFTNDHLHLLAAGYDQWVKLLTPILNNFRKT
ncbi:MAG: lysophospholipase L1-like esterase [Chloroflexi bacterium]|nr:MAG: lysophospholipase L1-like esterase [Chloroflexota bacterium]